MAENIDPLAKLFIQKATEFSEKYPEEGKRLYGELMYYTSTVAEAIPSEGRERSIWDIIKPQIEFRTRRRGRQKVTPEQFVEGLFSPNPKGEITADIIMGRLQVG